MIVVAEKRCLQIGPDDEKNVVVVETLMRDEDQTMLWQADGSLVNALFSLKGG